MEDGVDDTARCMPQARDRFLETGAPDTAAIRTAILTSWRRSQFFGVGVDQLEPPYRPDIDEDSHLVRAARPVLDRLENALAGTSMSVILTDGQGRVVQRRAGERSLNRHLDSIQLAPGFSYAEEFVGTNGIGTALEERQAFRVFGSEHFSQRLQSVSCAGAPIRNPVSGRIEGVIDLTCRHADANPLMAVLAEEAAADIQQRLAAIGSERERALLQEFLATCRRVRRPVVTLSEEVIITNSAASRLLEPSDHMLLWEKAVEFLGRRKSQTGEVVLSAGQPVRLRCRPVLSAVGTAGAVVEISTSDETPHRLKTGRARPSGPLQGVAGQNLAWTKVCEKIRRLCAGRVWILLAGEPGVGKLTVAKAAHMTRRPAAPLSVIDTADPPDQWLPLLEATIGRPETTVVLRHLDRLDPATTATLNAVLDRMDHAVCRPWVVGTVTMALSSVAGLRPLTRHFGESVGIPPLRHRINDVRDLIPVLLRRHAHGRDVTCTPEATQALLCMAWPGNVAQLEQVLRKALTRRPTGDLRLEDLPEECLSRSRRVLTEWEALERDAIIRALLEADGDKATAAARLGISRATIYRKIRAFGVVIGGRAG